MHFLIIGVGSIGERHLRNFLRIEGLQCSIAETNPSTRKKISSIYQAEETYADYRDAELSDFDGVVICVPANLHVPIATDIVNQGVHVLTEKPLAMSLEGVENLKRLRDEKGVLVSVAFTFRSDPLITEIKGLIDGRTLGTTRVIQFYAGQYWPRMRKDYPPQYAQSRESGGGAIPDHLVHYINFLEWMFGPAKEVSARQWNLALSDISTEDTGFVTLTFPGGEIASLGICLFQRDSNLLLRVIGDKGTIQMAQGSETLMMFDDKTGEWKKGKSRSASRDDVFLDQARHFIDCIQGKAQPRCSIEDAEHTLRTVLAALESSDSDGRFINVPR